MDVDHGQLVRGDLKDVAVVMGLRKLAPVGRRPPGGRYGWRLERLAEMRQDFPNRFRLRDKGNESDVAAARWALQGKLLPHPGHELGPGNS